MFGDNLEEFTYSTPGVVYNSSTEVDLETGENVALLADDSGLANNPLSEEDPRPRGNDNALIAHHNDGSGGGEEDGYGSDYDGCSGGYADAKSALTTAASTLKSTVASKYHDFESKVSRWLGRNRRKAPNEQHSVELYNIDSARDVVQYTDHEPYRDDDATEDDAPSFPEEPSSFDYLFGAFSNVTSNENSQQSKLRQTEAFGK